jgi:glucose-1-phosphate adenylyltransferase
MKKDKVVAMLLAGGQGSRLKLLTKNIAKPAVPFGGKYRIIDFALSNATNSGIRDIGILTQYKPFELNTHIGIGGTWDFDRNTGGLRILPPFMSEDGGRWYTGTANAIYENIDFVDNLDPEFVLILSGDHIYKMDYNELINNHRLNSSDVTIAVREVPWEQASRFGIVNVDQNHRIVEFSEKPEMPKNNMASMGIYVFNWKKLKSYLIQDAKNPDSVHDFGKNVLPLMLREGLKMHVYVFNGYWKDVGTVDSYWQSNMDLLDENNTLDLYDKNWRIYTRNKNLPPQYIAKGSVVNNSMINEGCVIEGEVHNSIIFSGVHIQRDAKVSNSVILSNARISPNVRVDHCVVLEDVLIHEGVKVGSSTNKDILIIDKDIE